MASTPDPAAPSESEPLPTPSVPGIGLWNDSDIRAAKGSARAGNGTPATADGADEPLSTIGHIGRYALKYRIGEGGLGTVYAAHDPLLSRLIAIKTLNLEISAEQRPAFNAMFLNEARAAASLSHPNIVTVFDAGVSDDNAYIAMELLKGRDLRQLRLGGWRPTPAQAALIVRRVADALAYAHSKGVVHRDIKPANVFMVGRTQPRVLDFGIARVAHQHDVHAGEGVVAGSPYYMAPEQVRQEPGDRRVDVFSLGVVLYELLTEIKPFRGGTLAEITKAVQEHQPPPAHEVNKDVPRALSEITARAMEKDPENRFRSARAFARELRHWLEEHGQETEAAEANMAADTEHRPGRSWVVAAGLGMLIGASAVWLALGAGEQAPPAVARAPAVRPVIPAAAVAISEILPAPVADPASAPDAPVVSSATQELVVEVLPSPEAVAPRVAEEVAPVAPVAPVTRVTPRDGARAAGRSPAKNPVRAATRETRDRPSHGTSAPAAAAAPGIVKLAISPWGEVEIDGTAIGTVPPLTEVTLSEGTHRVVVRNGDYPAYKTSVEVRPGVPVVLKHKFGS